MWLVETALLAAGWLAAAWLCRWLCGVLRMYWLTRRMPGPPAYPLVGSLLPFAGPQEELYEKVMALRKYGKVMRFWLGPHLGVVVSDPQDLQVVFTDPRMQSKPDFMYASSIEPALGAGLITMNGHEYRRHRKIVTPAFAQKTLHSFAPNFNANAGRLVERLFQLADTGEVFDATLLSRMCTSHAVLEAVLSDDSLQLDEDRRKLVQCIQEGVSLVFNRGMRPWYRSNLLFSLSKHYDDYQQIVKLAEDIVSHVLDIQKVRENGKSHSKSQGPKKLCFVDHLLSTEEGKAMSRDELAAELKHLISAANAGLSDAFSFLLYVLSLRQDIQDKVLEEMERELGAVEEEVQPADLVRLKYLDRVLKETFRIFAPGPLFARQPESDVTLPSGWVLPRGCLVFISPHFPHKDPSLWPDPELFDPDRFLPENSSQRHPHAYIPFSAGTRSCIGQRFSMMFLKTVACHVVRRFQLFPAPDGPQRVEDIKPVLSITLHVQGGARVFVRRRHVT